MQWLCAGTRTHNHRVQEPHVSAFTNAVGVMLPTFPPPQLLGGGDSQSIHLIYQCYRAPIHSHTDDGVQYTGLYNPIKIGSAGCDLTDLSSDVREKKNIMMDEEN